MIDRLGKLTDCADDNLVVCIKRRTPRNVHDDRSRLCAQPGIKRLRGTRKTAFNIHDCALLTRRVAQSLDGKPSDGASAWPRIRNLSRSATACKTHRSKPAPLGVARLCRLAVRQLGTDPDGSEAESGPEIAGAPEEHHAPTCPRAALSPLARSTASP